MVGRYQFAHVLIQHTLIEELSLTRRVRLHAQIAQSLEELYGAETGAHRTDWQIAMHQPGLRFASQDQI